MRSLLTSLVRVSLLALSAIVAASAVWIAVVSNLPERRRPTGMHPRHGAFAVAALIAAVLVARGQARALRAD